MISLHELVWMLSIQPYVPHVTSIVNSILHQLSIEFINGIPLYVLYILNMHIKFRSNQMLFTIRSINLFLIHNFRSQKLKILTFV